MRAIVGGEHEQPQRLAVFLDHGKPVHCRTLFDQGSGIIARPARA
jgi:hypothetical protein